MKRTWMMGMLAASALGIVACKQRDTSQDNADMRGRTTKSDTTTRSGATATNEKAQAKSVEGVVSDVKDDSFKVKTAAGDSVKLKVEDKASVMVNGQPFSSGALTEGRQVRASYTEQGGDNKVQNIEYIDANKPQPAPGEQKNY